MLGSVSEIVPSAVEKIIARCRRSSKFNRKAVNTMIIYRGHPANFSVATYDITEDCYVLCGHSGCATWAFSQGKVIVPFLRFCKGQTGKVINIIR